MEYKINAETLNKVLLYIQSHSVPKITYSEVTSILKELQEVINANKSDK